MRHRVKFVFCRFSFEATVTIFEIMYFTAAQTRPLFLALFTHFRSSKNVLRNALILKALEGDDYDDDDDDEDAACAMGEEQPCSETKITNFGG